MFSFNKQYGKEKEEKYVLLTQRLSDQHSLSQTQTHFQKKKLQAQKTTPNKPTTITMGSAQRKISNAEVRSYSAGKQ